MASFSKQFLSGSTGGLPVLVTATSSPGNTIHTTGTSSTIFDEVHLFAYNSDTASVVLTIQYGGLTTPDNDFKLTIPSRSGLTYVVPGLVLSGTGSSGRIVYAYAASASKITISGYVNRII